MQEQLTRCLEIDGARDFGVEVLCGACRDRLHAFVNLKSEIIMEVDGYQHVEGEPWDMDKFEESKCRLYGKATRSTWDTLYRIGRALARHGTVTINQAGKEPMIIVCDGNTEVTIN